MKEIGKRTQFWVAFPDGTVLYCDPDKLPKSPGTNRVLLGSLTYRNYIQRYHPELLEMYDKMRVRNTQLWAEIDTQMNQHKRLMQEEKPPPLLNNGDIDFWRSVTAND